jgi:hypothetical protein
MKDQSQEETHGNQGRTCTHNISEAQIFAGLREGFIFNISMLMIVLLSLLLALSPVIAET